MIITLFNPCSPPNVNRISAIRDRQGTEVSLRKSKNKNAFGFRGFGHQALPSGVVGVNGAVGGVTRGAVQGILVEARLFYHPIRVVHVGGVAQEHLEVAL